MSATVDNLIRLINNAKTQAEIQRILIPVNDRHLIEELVARADELQGEVPRGDHRAALN